MEKDKLGNLVAFAERQISEVATRRIAQEAFRLAQQRAATNGRATVTVVHKSNVLSLTDGLFRETCRSVYDSLPPSDNPVKYEEQIVDSMV